MAMALRRGFGCLMASVLLIYGCKDDAKPADKAGGKGGSLDARCEQLAKACGDKPKHVEKITAECWQTSAKQVAKGCIDQATVVYDCYEKELCTKDTKVWTIDDLRVLSDRHTKCVAERDLLRKCLGETP